jgi:hypothetical protein
MDADDLLVSLEEAVNPLDRQRAMIGLLSHEPRQIIQVILGHPASLASESELRRVGIEVKLKGESLVGGGYFS